MEQQGIQNVLRCLPQQVRSRIQQLTPSEQAQIQEIRLRAEREEQAMMTTLAGLVVVLMLLVDQIGTLFERVKSVFGL